MSKGSTVGNATALDGGRLGFRGIMAIVNVGALSFGHRTSHDEG